MLFQWALCLIIMVWSKKDRSHWFAYQDNNASLVSVAWNHLTLEIEKNHEVSPWYYNKISQVKNYWQLWRIDPTGYEDNDWKRDLGRLHAQGSPSSQFSPKLQLLSCSLKKMLNLIWFKVFDAACLQYYTIFDQKWRERLN